MGVFCILILTKLYTTSQSERTQGTNKSLTRWEETLGENIEEEDWAFCCTQLSLLTSNCNLKIIHFKFIHQMYYTQTKLYKYGLRQDDKCTRCGAPSADFLHMAWACPQVLDYWQEVVGALTQMIGETIPNLPRICLLGLQKLRLIRRRKFLAVSLLLAKRRIAIRWGSKRPPRFKEWLQDMAHCKESLSIYAEDLPIASRPRDFWEPLTLYLQM